MSTKVNSRARLARATTAALIQALEPRRLLAVLPYHWPAGAETLVNSFTTGFQNDPAIALAADGAFVVAWSSFAQDGSDWGVYAQRFNAAGVPQGSEFRVNTTTAFSQWNPSVAMDADGDFVIAWESGLVNYHGIGDTDIYAQRYNAAGVPQGSEFRVNSSTTTSHSYPSIAADADGDFIITWQTALSVSEPNGIYARRFNAAGAPQGSEFLVNTSTGTNLRSSVAMDADGDFIVAWERFSGQFNPSSYDVFAQRFNAAGVKQGSEFRVNSYTTNNQGAPSVAMDGDGDFVIAWHGEGAGDDYGVFARRFNAAGVAQGTEFRLNTFAIGTQRYPSVAMNGAGDFLVTYHSAHPPGFWYGIYAKRFDAAGAALGTEFRVSSHTTSSQVTPSAVMHSDGRFVITWSGAGQDVGLANVFLQRFTTFGTSSAATVGDRVWNDSNANGIQDAGEAGLAGVTVELLNAAGAPAAIVTTNATGQYSFLALAGTSAILHFHAPNGFLGTHQHRGNDAALDSDADRLTGLTPVFATGAAGTTNNTLDAGFYLPGSITGVAFNDRSGDGVRNGGEELLRGFRVYLDLNNNGALDAGEPITTTGAGGQYTFDNLFAEPYRVRVVDQTQWIGPLISQIQVLPNQTTTVDLALRTLAPDSIHTAQGAEFRVNSFTTGVQSDPAIAMDANGAFVVAWAGRGQGDDMGIFAQRYSAAGAPQGGEFLVNTTTTGPQQDVTVAMDADGDFVIAWSSGEVNPGIFAQRFNASGVKQGGEFRVSPASAWYGRQPEVAMDADGDFVVVWSGRDQYGNGVYARRYNAAGVAQGNEFRVDQDSSWDFHYPSVAMDADGDFVVAWGSTRVFYYGYYNEMRVRRYDSAGVPRGDEVLVQSPGVPLPGPSVAMDADGDFVVAWNLNIFHMPNVEVYAQRFAASGEPQGAAARVAGTNTPWPSSRPTVAMDASGDYVVVGTNYGQDGSFEGIYAQRFNSAGLPQGNEFRVNTFTLDRQEKPAVAMNPNGDFAVAWESYGQDGSISGIYAQRYAVSQRPAVTSSQFIWETAPQRLTFAFDQNVSASLSLSDILVQDLTHGTTVTPSGLSYNAATNTATITFTDVLPDARYRATLFAAGVSNGSGTTLAVDYALDFFFLQADANRDGVVNLADFNRLAANFGQSPRTFSQGDFNYDGVVNLADFNILASRFGVALGAPVSGRPFGQVPVGSSPTDSDPRPLVGVVDDGDH